MSKIAEIGCPGLAFCQVITQKELDNWKVKEKREPKRCLKKAFQALLWLHGPLVCAKI